MLRYLNLAEYVSDEDALEHMNAIAGEEGAQGLLSKEAGERRAAVDKLVPKALGR